MKQLKWYGSLETSDVDEFEKHLIQWAERNALNSTFIFDETSLNKVSKQLICMQDKNDPSNGHIQVCMPEKEKRLMTQKLIIEWYSIGGKKCILKSIQTKSGKILYTEPNQWKNTALWFAF